jgi:DNA-binding transcriptional LysR family regulator
LAGQTKPLGKETIEQHRAVAIADTAKRLPARTVGILDKQPVLTVPDLEAKLAALRSGIGVGWLPSWVAKREVRAKNLLIKAVKSRKPSEVLYLAWRSGENAKALDWWLRQLRDKKSFSD